MKLVFTPNPEYIHKVLVVAHESQILDKIDYERTRPFDAETIWEFNPMGKVPSLVLDNGELLFGGLVICQYFDSLASDGKTVSFQSALNLIYTHSGTASNSGKSYDGAKSLLSYEGPGRLTGLPTFCLNPNTGLLAAECVPEGHANSTANGFDINIDPTSVLEDSDENKYYAKMQTMEEIYPVVGDETHATCSGLTLPDGSGVVKPALGDVYIAPGHLGQSFPTASELESGDYLDDGEPAVIAGATLKELREAAIALEAA